MKKLLMILLPVLVLAGAGVFVAAQKGMINIPGVTPKKKANAAALYGTDKDLKPKPKPKRKPEPKPAPVSSPAIDPVQGRKKLAALWDSMTIDALVKVVQDWDDLDLALQISEMDEGQATKLLEAISAMDPKRASSLSKKIQAAASQIEGPES